MINEVFPYSFSSIFYQIFSVYTREKFSFSDEWIGFIKKYIDVIWKVCFSADFDPDNFDARMNELVQEKIRFENIPNII